MKTKWNQLILGIGLLVTGSCVCEEADFFVSPEDIGNAFQVTDVTYSFGDDIFPPSLILRFNDNLDTSTVQINKTLFIEGDQLDYNNTFTPFYNSIIIELCAFGCQADVCELQITLRSNPNNQEGIRSNQGAWLDGDRDGHPGGEYHVVLDVESCQ